MALTRTPMKRSRKPVKRRSDRRVIEDQIYKELREAFLAKNRRCQIRWDRGCAGHSSEVHHKISRGVRPDLYLVVSNFLAACRHCHQLATDNQGESYERNTSGKSTDAPNSSKIVPRPELTDGT